ncbi:MAG: sirohydrochlorin cobaltochelatase, partial [Clostridia bacterium]|nr:sirohydrochlorin cobaltochelatase [Clostridia bacterium]
MKKLFALLIALILALTCAAALAEEEDEENYETGDATLDLVRNEDEIGEKELLVVSFGTSFNDSRRLTIGGIEAAITEAVPDFSVRRGFTAQIIIDHVERRDGIHIDNVTEALERAV